MKLRAKKPVSLLLGSVMAGILVLFAAGIYAAPFSDFSWTPPTNYENGTVIDSATDTLTYSLYCSGTSGGPYDLLASNLTGNSINGQDVTSCVNGVAGTYYYVATATSSLYNSESAFSGEASRTYTSVDLGQIPNPPTILSVQ